MKSLKRVLIGVVTAFVLLLSGCSTTAAFQGPGGGRVVDIAISYQDADIAASEVLSLALENLGFRVNIINLDYAIMYMAVAEGDADATISSWLPSTHEPYMPRFYDDMVDLGPNTTGTLNALVVPSYMEADSITDLTDEAGQVITGIEPGAGITSQTETAIETYPNLEGWEHRTSSTGGMLIELQSAIRDQEEIIIPGWQPHWMNISYDLKYLEDPEGVFGGREDIITFARQGLQEEDPIAYGVIDNFYWDIEDVQEVMYDMEQNGMTGEEAALKWVNENPDKVNAWYEGVEGLEDAEFQPIEPTN